jgi:predicted outer membrane repeat protein
MSTSTVAPSNGRRLARVAAVVALATTILVGPLALSSSAANYTADSEATWRIAVAAAQANVGETNSITLTGDFAMNDPSGMSPLYVGTDDLVIDGNGHTVTAAPGNTAYFLLSSNDGGSDFSMHNITLSGFESDYTVAVINSDEVDIFDLEVSDFDGTGSALYLSGTTVTIEDSVFTDNTGSFAAGPVTLNCSNQASVSRSTFTTNSGSMGGALNAGGPCGLYIYDSTFTDNSTTGHGGAVNAQATVDVYDSTFRSNSAADDGGAVYSYLSTFVENSLFTNNQAVDSGGAVYAEDGHVVSSHCTFDSNTAGGFGGGAYGDDFADSFESTWVGNTASLGGAVYTENADGSSWSLASTYVDNTAVNAGGAIFAGDSAVVLFNSVFTGNEASSNGAHIVSGDGLDTYASVFDDAVGAAGCEAVDVHSSGYNFDDDGSCTADWSQTSDFGLASDPMLGVLADNGGPTRTRHPLPGSPLIDVISPLYCSSHSASPWDQRLVDRDDTGAATEGCDIGSVEVINDLSFPIVGSTGTTTVTVSGALDYGCDAWTPIVGYPVTPPAGISFPHGVFDYCFDVPGGDWTVTVTLALPSPVNTLWKSTSGTWSEVSGVAFNGSTVRYNITDGGPLDEDGVSDGVIMDPIGPGLRAGFTG